MSLRCWGVEGEPIMDLSALDSLLLLSVVTVLFMVWLGRVRWAGGLAFVLYVIQLIIVAVMAEELGRGEALVLSLDFNVAGMPLHWRLDGLGWFFAVITLGAAALCSLFTAGEDYRVSPLLHLTLALNVLAMLLLLASGDLLSLFIGWELVSWASFAIMTYHGGAASRAAFRYLMYALTGAMLILAALVWLQVQGGSLEYATVRGYLAGIAGGEAWAVLLLLGAGFAIKMGLVPFHLWQAEAYAETPGPGAAFLGAVSSRMGLFALAVLLLQLVGLEQLQALTVPLTFIDGRDLWTAVAAVTMVVPTFIALRQTDARLLLAWHGIGQGGYMLLGILIGSSLGTAGGLMHVFNHATYQAALFLAVTAVIYRTGTSDLDRLGGLITRMPLSYVTMLVGIIGLAGLPPMNGFVSKWLIYKALLNEGMPLLFMAAIIGTLGTILSVYKLIHNIFLGQLRHEHSETREVPVIMVIPMLALSAIVFLTGFMPGLVLSMTNIALADLGLPALVHHLGGVETPTGSLNMLWVVGALSTAILIGAVIFLLGNPSRKVHQLDNYAGGHFLSADVRYHYSHDFYPGLMRVIGGWYRGSVGWLEQGLTSALDWLAGVSRGWYRTAVTPVYLLVITVLAMWWVVSA